MNALRAARHALIWLLCALMLSGCFARGTRPPPTPTLNAAAPEISPIAPPAEPTQHATSVA
jgi:hypothetical protein